MHPQKASACLAFSWIYIEPDPGKSLKSNTQHSRATDEKLAHLYSVRKYMVQWYLTCNSPFVDIPNVAVDTPLQIAKSPRVLAQRE